MSQTVKTLAFIIVAGLSLVIAWSTHKSYEPVDLSDFSDVGEDFYPKFEDPNIATAMQVAAYNSETGKTDVFKVEFKDGLWRIPSHHNYPADAEDRLAKTAATMIGVKRKAMVERAKAAHKRYGLLDPTNTETTSTEGHGDRVTLYKDDEILADLIIGNKVENEEETYYVRRSDEDRFYTADLGQLDISTKFSDWIASDILDVNKNKIRELIIDRYQIDEAQGSIIKGDRMVLDRESATAAWNLKGLDEAKEKLKTADIDSMLTALDDLEIVGVRPKPPGISADLKTDDGISIDSFEMMQLQDRGFFIVPSQGRILSNEGEVLVGTDTGALYVLRFGEEFSATDIELEAGSKNKGEAKAEKPKAEAEPKSEEEEITEEVKDGLKKSRFVFVTVQFDKELLGEVPIEPTKPEPPVKEEAKPEGEAKPEAAADDAKVDDVKTDDAEQKPEDSVVKLQKEYEAALVKYEDELAVYSIRKREYDEKTEQGQKQVSELNRRFADWFYVISADVFDRMKLNRVDLIENIAPPATEEPATQQPPTQNPTPPKSDNPAPTEPVTETTEKVESDQPAMKKPESETPQEPADKESPTQDPVEKKTETPVEKPAETPESENKTDPESNDAAAPPEIKPATSAE